MTDRYPNFFDPDLPKNLAFAFPRFSGREGAASFALSVARAAGLLILPSGLWGSPLAPVPPDRLRFGLGHVRSAEALAQFDAYLQSTMGDARAG